MSKPKAGSSAVQGSDHVATWRDGWKKGCAEGMEAAISVVKRFGLERKIDPQVVIQAIEVEMRRRFR